VKNISDTAYPMPDVASQVAQRHGCELDWVGMDGIELPICFDGGDGDAQRVAATLAAYVNLSRTDLRGIHMSRLYLLLSEHLGDKRIDTSAVESLLQAMLRSHQGLSDSARVCIRFEQLVRRTALRSDHRGWRAYPVSIEAELNETGFRLELGVDVVYSSTCPASAALSRQLIQQQFRQHFAATAPLDHAEVLAWLGTEQGIIATPHAQRSIASVRVRFVEGASLQLISLVDRIEQCLGTPVQTAVKREDEQAFALANGRNLMFCEDAARRIHAALDADQNIDGFCIRVRHQESLHPHDAVAEVRKAATAANSVRLATEACE
jgi:GTP cyclohydrolase I